MKIRAWRILLLVTTLLSITATAFPAAVATPLYLTDVTFTGELTNIAMLIGATTWTVQVDEVLSGPSLDPQVDAVYVVVPDCFDAEIDPGLEVGDEVEIRAIYESPSLVRVCGAGYYIREIDDATPPSITNIRESGDPINKDGCPEPTTVTIRADVTDESGVDWVELVYYFLGGSWFDAPMILESGNTYKATIGPFSQAGTLNYYIRARDNEGNETQSSTRTVTVNDCPTPTSTPTRTPTPTRTRTPTITATPTSTGIPTNTPTRTPTPSPTPSGDYIEVHPPNPTENDEIQITVFGTWGDSCAPAYVWHDISGNTITIMANANMAEFCLPVVTDWEFTVGIGRLSSGTYTVEVYIYEGWFGSTTLYGRETFYVSPITPTSTATATPTSTATPTNTPTRTPTPTPTLTPGHQDVYLPIIAKYPTPAPTPTPTHTATPTITPTRTPAPPSTPTPLPSDQLIINCGFETDEGWLFGETPRPAAYTTVDAHWGARSVRLGIRPPTTDAYSWSSVRQRITIPANARTATLSFWCKPFTECTCRDSWQQFDWSGFSVDQPGRISPDRNPRTWAACDWQQALILADDFPDPTILATVMNINSNSGVWTHQTFDLTPFAGQTVWVYFNVYNDGWGYRRTWMYVDDASVMVYY